MLLSNKDAQVSITFFDILTKSERGKTKWVAKYSFGKAKRIIVNKVEADFVLKGGLIIKHTDSFDL